MRPRNLAALEKKTRRFAAAMRETTIPARREGRAPAPISPRWSRTACFRTADGEFHGFEGANDQRGCCHGNCTHVWNYETSTRASFSDASRARCAKPASATTWTTRARMHFRENLPRGKERSGLRRRRRADGPDHARLSRLVALRRYANGCASSGRASRKRIEFAWIPGGWDADRDGVLEGVQHNTYDVEFYGPNPHVRHLLSGRAARRRGDGARRGRYGVGRGISPPLRERQQMDRRQSVQRRILHPEDPRHRERPDRRQRCAAPWAPTIPRIRNTRWATAAWSISWWASIWRTSPGWVRWCLAANIRKTLRFASTATTTSAPSPDHDTVQRTFVAERRGRAGDLRLRQGASARAFRFPITPRR